jgi:quercetin dioxygenase-like cupin family protein
MAKQHVLQIGTVLVLLAASWQACGQKRTVELIRAGTQPSAPGPAETFTGNVRVDPLFPMRAPARASASNVTFEPGARSAWHTHPLGQTLVMTSGAGLVQQWGQPAQVMRPGDVVLVPPNTKHWHGACATTAVSHTAIQEALDGKVVEWLEQVSDVQYRDASAALQP